MAHTVYRLSLAASLCSTWRERNFQVFQQHSTDVSGVIRQIEGDIMACMGSWRGIKNSDSNRLLASRWRVSAARILVLDHCSAILLMLLFLVVISFV